MEKLFIALLRNAIGLAILFGFLWLLTMFASTSIGSTLLIILLIPFTHYFNPEPLKMFARMHRENKWVQFILAEQYAEIIWEENGRPPIGIVGSLLKHGYSDWYRQKFLPEQKRREVNEEKHSKALDDFYK
jgi:hypothetical protein